MPTPLLALIATLAQDTPLAASERVRSIAEAPTAPPGFAVDLVVSHPQVKWPSAVHCREDGALLVAEDAMDMPGPADQPIDKIWLLRFAADGSYVRTLFCDRLFAVMGIQEIDDAIYVMNMPHLTVLRDRNGDGVAEERRELLTDLGPNAPGWPGGFNDHIVSGLRLGMDGWLYVSVGDKGVPGAHGVDGSTIQLHGGGVVRVRPDGTQLEVVATGTRNHLDVALDERDEIFTYDNTDDGLGWWTRFTHVMPTGYYGYPYDYHDHPERMLPCMKDDGGGSGVGSLVYREAAWPSEYRGAVLACDWTDRVVRRYTVERDGATFRCTGSSDFLAAGGSGELRPLDLCESPDGRYLYVADWNHPGWTTPDVAGHVWRVRQEPDLAGPMPIGDLVDGTLAARAKATVAGLLANLAHPSFRRRVAAQRELTARAVIDPTLLHAIAATATQNLDERARRHAIWALAEASRASGSVGADAAGRLQSLAASIRTEAGRGDDRAQLARALGQLRSTSESMVSWLRTLLAATSEPVARREAAIALGRRGDVTATEPLIETLTTSDDRFLRFASRQALRALVSRPEFDAKLLLQKFVVVTNPAAQAELWLALRELYDLRLVDALIAAVEKSTVAPQLRAQALLTLAEVEKRAPPWDGKWWLTQPAKNPPPAKSERWEGTARIAAVIQRAFEGDPPPELRETLATIARLTRSPALLPPLRRLAQQCTDLAERAQRIALLAELRDTDAVDWLRAQLADSAAVVRAAAVTSLATLLGSGAGEELRHALDDTDAAVVRAARIGLSQWPQRTELGSFVAGLSGSPEEQAACRGALIALRHEVRGELEKLATRGVLAGDALAQVREIYDVPQPLLAWQLLGPFEREVALASPADFATASATRVDVTAALPHGFVDLKQRLAPRDHVAAYARATFDSTRARAAQVSLGSDDGVTVWCNGTLVHSNLGDRAWGPDQDRFQVALVAGRNELLLRIEQNGGDWAFNVKVSEESTGPLFDGATAAAGPAEIAFDLATWREFAVVNRGDPTRGKALFFSEQGPGCFRCHAVAGVGPLVGPDLRDVGTKYPRAELITSILEPSQRIQDGYRATNLVLADGDVISGLITKEAEGVLTMVDATARPRTLRTDQVRSRKESKLSAMPSGLAEPLRRQELADLVSWLETLRQ